MGLKKGYTFTDRALPCPECGKTFKTPQALENHRRGHLARADISEQKDSARLAEEVRVLKLEAEKRRLEATSKPPAPSFPDAAEVAGLGKMQPAVAERVQSRAFGLASQPQSSWVDKFLSNPEGLKLAVDALRGIIGTSYGDSGLAILKEIGIDIKELFNHSRAPASGAIKIAGIDLTGVPLTSNVLTALIDYEAKKEAAEREAESRNSMAESWKKALELLEPLIESKLGNGSSSGGGIGARVSESPSSPARALQNRYHFICKNCNAEVPLPEGTATGESVICPVCGDKYVKEISSAPPQINKEVKSKAIPVEKITMKCKCGQSIDVTGVPLLSDVKCPVCGAIAKVTSPDEPLEPQPVSEQEKYQSLFEKNQGGY